MRGILPGHSDLIGTFRMGDVLEWYDRPILYTAVDDLGRTYLAMAVDDTSSLLIPVSDQRLTSIRTGVVSVRGAYSDPEFPSSILAFDGGEFERLDGVPDRFLPPGDLFLSEQLSTAEQFSSEWLQREAQAQGRHLVAIELKQDDDRTEPRLRSMTTMLGEYQEVTDRLHFDGVGGRREQDRVDDAEQTFVQLKAASVVFVVAAAPGAQLFNTANNGASRLMDLVGAANDETTFTSSVHALGKPSVTHLRNFFDSVADQESSLRIYQASPSGEAREVAAPLPAIREGLRIIRTTSPAPAIEHQLVGRLVALDAEKRTFGFSRETPERGKKRRFNGKIDASVATPEGGFKVGTKNSPLYRAVILQEQDESIYTQKKWRSRFTLTEIDLVAISDS